MHGGKDVSRIQRQYSQDTGSPWCSIRLTATFHPLLTGRVINGADELAKAATVGDVHHITLLLDA